MIFNLIALLQVMFAIGAAAVVFVLAVVAESPAMFVFSFAVFGFMVALIDAGMRARRTPDGARYLDALSPWRGGHVFFIPTWMSGGTLAVLFSLLGLQVMLAPERIPEPGEESFNEAHNKVTTDVDGVANGNTPAAQKMASEVSSKGHVFRQLAISGEDSAWLTGGEFLTYAHVDGDSAVFLVHVPSLRRYDDDAKEAVAEYLLAAATDVVGSRLTSPAKIAIATRGTLLYDTILEQQDGGTPRSVPKESLYEYFLPGPDLAPVEPVAAPTP